jgi:hypothetical protein
MTYALMLNDFNMSIAAMAHVLKKEILLKHKE